MAKDRHLLATLSGGLDSAVSLAMAVDLLSPTRIGAIHFEYTQTNSVPESQAFYALCDHFGIAEEDRFFFTIPALGGSALTTAFAPDGIGGAKGIPSTYVPNRNMIIIARAAAQALQQGYGALCIGVHEQDADYPDCTASFVNIMKRALSEATAGEVSLYAPILKMSKIAIVRTGLRLKVPFELTWSCYNPVEQFSYVAGDPELKVRYEACGVCTTCKLRLAAFENNGIPDPIEYAQEHPGQEV